MCHNPNSNESKYESFRKTLNRTQTSSYVMRPIPRCRDLPVPKPHDNMEYSSDFEYRDMSLAAGDDA